MVGWWVVGCTGVTDVEREGERERAAGWFILLVVSGRGGWGRLGRLGEGKVRYGW